MEHTARATTALTPPISQQKWSHVVSVALGDDLRPVSVEWRRPR